MFFSTLVAIGGGLSGALFSLIGVGMMLAPDKPDDPQSGLIILALAAVICFCPALIGAFVAFRISALRRRLDRISTLAATNVRLSLRELASEFRTDEATAQLIVLRAVECGMAQGRLDIEPGFFVSATASSVGEERHVTCTNCGAPVSFIALPGVIAQCGHCGVHVA